MQITGSMVDWPLYWGILGGVTVICGLTALTGWALRGAWKMSKRKDL